jgi:hypothetical protein
MRLTTKDDAHRNPDLGKRAYHAFQYHVSIVKPPGFIRLPIADHDFLFHKSVSIFLDPHQAAARSPSLPVLIQRFDSVCYPVGEEGTGKDDTGTREEEQ